jgi:glycosyltransferase involved in cell wall biosynthesis
MTICFIHPHKAFLPGVIIYKDFFKAYEGITIKEVKPQDLHTVTCDVEWHFMGQQVRRKKEVITIHEYVSAAVPPFSILKDNIKKLINTQPDYRIFGNDYALQQYRPKDKIPFGIRDYGIPNTITLLPAEEKKYDFVYVGTVDKSRKIEVLLDRFASGSLKDRTLLVLTRDYDTLANAYANATNITFKGPIPNHEVYAQLQQARFGINYMPDIIPYNQQTSAKFLDYAACGMPVVTNDYAWVRHFQKQFGGNYFYLHADLSNFTWENVNSSHYTLPNLTTWTREKQIRRSGVLEFLESRFTGVKFSK